MLLKDRTLWMALICALLIHAIPFIRLNEATSVTRQPTLMTVSLIANSTDEVSCCEHAQQAVSTLGGAAQNRTETESENSKPEKQLLQSNDHSAKAASLNTKQKAQQSTSSRASSPGTQAHSTSTEKGNATHAHTGSAQAIRAQGYSNAKPKYPLASRIKREEGSVVLSLLVNEDGSVETLIVTQSSGYHRLDTSAKMAAKSWRFLPAQNQGKAVASWFTLKIQFQLEK